MNHGDDFGASCAVQHRQRRPKISERANSALHTRLRSLIALVFLCNIPVDGINVGTVCPTRQFRCDCRGLSRECGSP